MAKTCSAQWRLCITSRLILLGFIDCSCTCRQQSACITEWLQRQMLCAQYPPLLSINSCTICCYIDKTVLLCIFLHYFGACILALIFEK